MKPNDYKVADLSLAAFGRREIKLAEHEMPGLMATRAEYADAQPLRGAAIAGSLHMTIQTAGAHRDLVALGGGRALGQLQHLLDTGSRCGQPWSSARTDPRNRRVACPSSRGKGETLEEYWWCTERSSSSPTSRVPRTGPNMILDDGGDATLLVPQGVEFERAGAVPQPTGQDPAEYRVILENTAAQPAADNTRFTRMAEAIIGVTEETTTGVHRLYEFARTGDLLFPAINVNDSVTKSKFDNKYGCRHSLIDGITAPPTFHRRQGRGGMRLWRRRQGLRRVAARAGRASDHHRDRSDLRAAGRDGRLPGDDAREGHRHGRLLRHHDRQ